MLQKEELKRYDRHLILPEIGLEGQVKLKNAKVLVVGAGGLGCPVLQYLAAAGVGTLGILDFDVVEESNLQRQILFGMPDLGRKKAEAAAEKLALLNPFIRLQVFNERFQSENAEGLLSDFDLIIDGSDNFPTRYLVNDVCVALGKPLVF
ncbi:MAG TPA: HesA/MoeB/ThiF family protein, partial [Adhaeribacter sp.]|nr:HesA/MoeB/ThiF family protein [Adhaeribacter sp.]